MTEPRPGALTPKLSEMLIAEIKRQAVSGKSSRQLSRDFGVHYQTVANYRRKLEKAGVIQRLRAGSVKLNSEHPASGHSAAPISGTLDVADFWTSMPDLAILTGEQILKRLTYLSMSPAVPATVHVAASKALYELREAEEAKESLTAHDPRTPAEFSERLYVMRSCVGQDAWRAADARASLEEDTWKMTGPLGSKLTSTPSANETSKSSPSSNVPAPASSEATTAAAPAVASAAAVAMEDPGVRGVESAT